MSTILTMLVAAMVAPSLTYMVLGSTQLLQQDRSAYAQTDSRDTITPFNTKVP
jgi:glutamyl-tRNA reductase